MNSGETQSNSLDLLRQNLVPAPDGKERGWSVSFATERKVFADLQELGLIPVGANQEQYFSMLSQSKSGETVDSGPGGMSYETFISIKKLIERVLDRGAVIKVPTEALQRTGMTEPEERQKEDLNRRWILLQIREVLDKHVAMKGNREHATDLSATAEALSEAISPFITASSQVPKVIDLTVLALNKASGQPLEARAPSGAPTVALLKAVIDKVVGLEKVCKVKTLDHYDREGRRGLQLILDFISKPVASTDTSQPSQPRDAIVQEPRVMAFRSPSAQTSGQNMREALPTGRISLKALVDLKRNVGYFNETYRNSGLGGRGFEPSSIQAFLDAWNTLRLELVTYPELYVPVMKGGVEDERRVADMLTALEKKGLTRMSILTLLQRYQSSSGRAKDLIAKEIGVELVRKDASGKSEVSSMIRVAVEKLIEDA